MKKYILVLCVICAFKGFGTKISSAYEALSVYDYFKARALFYSSLSKYPSEAGYGLATIYYRNDNPFSNIDSAAKYIARSAKTFKDTARLSGYVVSPATIASLSRAISLKGFQQHARHNTACDLNYFLEQFWFSSDSLLRKALWIRDDISLKRYSSSRSSDSIRVFLWGYPESELYGIAKKTLRISSMPSKPKTSRLPPTSILSWATRPIPTWWMQKTGFSSSPSSSTLPTASILSLPVTAR